MHYVIGDVHGYYKTLLALIDLLPKDAEIIFVGDLIDRGPRSAEVVSFIREKGYACVKGNHEDFMATLGPQVVSSFVEDTPLYLTNLWHTNGGIDTLISYGLLKIVNGKPDKVKDYKLALLRFVDDMKWMEKLPLYLEFGIKESLNKPIIVSHAPIADVWEMRDEEEMYSTFHNAAITNRINPGSDAPIFNIFGHTPVKRGVEVNPYYVNVDTGCYLEKDGYKRLSAYCIETGETVSAWNVK